MTPHPTTWTSTDPWTDFRQADPILGGLLHHRATLIDAVARRTAATARANQLTGYGYLAASLVVIAGLVVTVVVGPITPELVGACACGAALALLWAWLLRPARHDTARRQP